MKIGASFIYARKNGPTTAFDEINKFFQFLVFLLFQVIIGIISKEKISESY